MQFRGFFNEVLSDREYTDFEKTRNKIRAIEAGHEVDQANQEAIYEQQQAPVTRFLLSDQYSKLYDRLTDIREKGLLPAAQISILFEKIDNQALSKDEKENINRLFTQGAHAVQLATPTLLRDMVQLIEDLPDHIAAQPNISDALDKISNELAKDSSVKDVEKAIDYLVGVIKQESKQSSAGNDALLAQIVDKLDSLKANPQGNKPSKLPPSIQGADFMNYSFNALANMLQNPPGAPGQTEYTVYILRSGAKPNQFFLRRHSGGKELKLKIGDSNDTGELSGDNFKMDISRGTLLMLTLQGDHLLRKRVLDAVTSKDKQQYDTVRAMDGNFAIRKGSKRDQFLSSIGNTKGEGIKLFGSIKEMVDRLETLIGLFRAGNKGSDIRNEISGVLDLLLKKKAIKQKEHEKLFYAFVNSV